jgi:hypothetical protein
MTYALSWSIGLGPANTGIADWRAQLVDTLGADVGAAISTGFFEVGTGFYGWYYSLVPDGHTGGVKFYQDADPTAILGYLSINPQEAENTDVKTSTRLATAGYTAPDNATITAISVLLTTVATYIDTEVAAIKAKTDNIPSDPADASDIAASFVSVASTLTTVAGYLDTEIAAIKAKTDNLPTDPADESSIQATLTTIAGYLDTEIATLLSRLGVPSVSIVDDLAAIQADTDDLQAQIGVAGAGLTDLPPIAVEAEIDASDIWTYASRTLTQVTVSQTEVPENIIDIYQGVTLNVTLTGLTIPATWTVCYFTIKSDRSQADSLAHVQIKESNPGAGGDGLQRLNGSAGTANQGELVVNQAGGTLQVILADDATALLALRNSLYYDVKFLKADGTSSRPAADEANVLPASTLSLT